MIRHANARPSITASRGLMASTGRLVTLLNAAPWMRSALCRKVDPDVFHPQGPNTSQRAKDVCAECPVIRECLDHAIAQREEWGVWGGMTFVERKEEIKRRRTVTT